MPKKSKVIEAPIEEEPPQIAEEAPKEKEAPKRTGRPVGAKDSKPRQKKVDAVEPKRADTAEPPRTASDPVQDYLETRRMAAERVYHAQGEHWLKLASHLLYMGAKRIPTSIKDRYAVLENYKKLGELNEFRRRKMEIRNALNHHLELERLRGHAASQRMHTLAHTRYRMAELRNLIQKINPEHQS